MIQKNDDSLISLWCGGKEFKINKNSVGFYPSYFKTGQDRRIELHRPLSGARPDNPELVEYIFSKKRIDLNNFSQKDALKIYHTADYLLIPFDRPLFIYAFKKKYTFDTIDPICHAAFENACNNIPEGIDVGHDPYCCTVYGKHLTTLDEFTLTLRNQFKIPLTQLTELTFNKLTNLQSIHHDWMDEIYTRCPALKQVTLSDLALTTLKKNTFLKAHKESTVILRNLSVFIEKKAFSSQWENGILIIDHCKLSKKSTKNIQCPEPETNFLSLCFGPKPGYQIITYKD